MTNQTLGIRSHPDADLRAVLALDHQVLVVGGGPTGLMLAGELALAGVDVAIVERREKQALAGMRAGGLHMRTIEVLDQRGIGDRFVALGQRHPVMLFHGPPLDVSDFPTRRNYFLGLSQNYIESILADWAADLGVRIHRGRDAVGVSQDENGVRLAMSDGQTLAANYLVGCDGARSMVRKAAGIEFAGWDPTKSWLIAEVEWAQEPEWGFRQDADSTYALGKMDDPAQVRIVLSEPTLKDGSEPSLEEVKATLIEVYGTDYGVRNPTWISRFTDRCRQAVSYRHGRVFVAGDAAHIHPPMGGQGLNIGLQDAVNLGWKLARVVKGLATDDLLDTYQAERHPVGARVLRNTMADVALQRQDDRAKALGAVVAELAALDGPRQRIIGERSGLSLRYELGEGHPLLGLRMPDLDIETADGPNTVYAFLHQGRPTVLNFNGSARLDVQGWSDQVQVVEARCADRWELPVIGVVEAPRAVLVRPDGYVAWVGPGDGDDLEAALRTWVGSPRTP